VNLLRIWPSICIESCDTSITIQIDVLLTSATCSQVAAVYSCLLSVLPVSYKNRQCIAAIVPNQPEFISISNRFYVENLSYSACYINEFTLIYLAHPPGLCYSFRLVKVWEGVQWYQWCYHNCWLWCSVYLHSSAVEGIGHYKSWGGKAHNCWETTQHPCLMMWLIHLIKSACMLDDETRRIVAKDKTEALAGGNCMIMRSSWYYSLLECYTE
jgi:hypothetical protein